jgi:hypothetical protein
MGWAFSARNKKGLLFAGLIGEVIIFSWDFDKNEIYIAGCNKYISLIFIITFYVK